ncbi:hypothetical protein CPAR01_16042 [Colletotrichum paranaense]|uniref:Uncharacterized protein n=1 Tax=Colletotrichum paranaense TaxID=1914294 RepID=A0ABQ9RXH1_9PEZI|nr:uncharacterized protein CPAR01_16042 [Colletotrichum paranaense]KAK1517562.1 hypothetical protein CPAR01_16042 [Colletotrichum paranaense]
MSAPAATFPSLHFMVVVRPTQRGGITQTLVDLNHTSIWIKEKRMVASNGVRSLPCHPLLGFLACDCGTCISPHTTWSCLGKSAISIPFPLQEVMGVGQLASLQEKGVPSSNMDYSFYFKGTRYTLMPPGNRYALLAHPIS